MENEILFNLVESLIESDNIGESDNDEMGEHNRWCNSCNVTFCDEYLTYVGRKGYCTCHNADLRNPHKEDCAWDIAKKWYLNIKNTPS